MSERAAPFYCPYCGEEDLRPPVPDAGPDDLPGGAGHGHGQWRCGACTRVFSLRFVGLQVAPAGGPRTTPEVPEVRA